MPRATLAITLPDEMWLAPVTRENPDATFRVLSALPAEDGAGVGLVEARDISPETMRTVVASSDALRDGDVLRAEDGVLVQFETRTPTLLSATRSAKLPLDFPFEVSDGVARWTLTATHERLTRLGDELDARGVDYQLERVDTTSHPDADPLTDRQRDVLESAAAAGYYDEPRACSLTDVADDVGLAKSTVSGILHRAERALVESYLDA